MRYLAVGGRGDLFDVDAHLHAVTPLRPFDRDVLAYALNARLNEMYQEACVPYLITDPQPTKVDLETTVGELLDSMPPPTRHRDAGTAD